jgi:hypothetical protein
MVEHKGQAREYIMNEKRMKRLKNLGYDLKCFRCERPIVIGDHVMHKRKKIYHYQCWEQIWLDIPDLDPEDEFFIEYGFYPTSSSFTTSSTISPSTITINLNT